MQDKKGNKLRLLREQLGISQRKAAELIICPLSTYQKWDGGQTHYHPRVVKFLKLAHDASKREF